MKKLTSLLLIILVTAISWTSCAKSKAIKVTAIYTLPYSVLPTSLLTATLSKLSTNDNLNFPQVTVVSEHNRFFELSIVFNEKLQQIISFFTRSADEKSDVMANSFPSYTSNQSTGKACQHNN
ncbi:MAG: hypothetical protein JKX90_06505 [Colwellia sp.]|jgi:phenylalanyl-tRNA synthetase beta subunit|nr:hypothetical protein [Colwellia sp.]